MGGGSRVLLIVQRPTPPPQQTSARVLTSYMPSMMALPHFQQSVRQMLGFRAASINKHQRLCPERFPS